MQGNNNKEQAKPLPVYKEDGGRQAFGILKPVLALHGQKIEDVMQTEKATGLSFVTRIHLHIPEVKVERVVASSAKPNKKDSIRDACVKACDVLAAGGVNVMAAMQVGLRSLQALYGSPLPPGPASASQTKPTASAAAAPASASAAKPQPNGTTAAQAQAGSGKGEGKEEGGAKGKGDKGDAKATASANKRKAEGAVGGGGAASSSSHTTSQGQPKPQADDKDKGSAKAAPKRARVAEAPAEKPAGALAIDGSGVGRAGGLKGQGQGPGGLEPRLVSKAAKWFHDRGLTVAVFLTMEDVAVVQSCAECSWLDDGKLSVLPPGSSQESLLGYAAFWAKENDGALLSNRPDAEKMLVSGGGFSASAASERVVRFAVMGPAIIPDPLHPLVARLMNTGRA